MATSITYKMGGDNVSTPIAQSAYTSGTNPNPYT